MKEPCSILLIHPSTKKRAPLSASLAKSEHLGLSYLVSALKLSNHSCRILDLESSPIEPATLASQIVKDQLKVIGFSPTSQSALNAIEIMAEIRKLSNNIIFIWGGHLTSGLREELFNHVPLVDAIVIGDGIPLISMIVETATKNNAIPKHEKILINPKTAFSAIKVSHNPFTPTWDELIPTRTLSSAEYRRYGVRILTTLGCPFDCVFCTTPFIFGSKIIYRKIPHIISEIKNLHTKFGANRIWINDDLFLNPSPKSHIRALEFAKAFSKISNNLKFRPLCRPDSFKKNPGIIELLSSYGMDIVFIGFESGDNNTLNYLKKHTNTKISKNTYIQLQKAGIKTQIGFIMFTPNATINSLRRNVDFLYDIDQLYRIFPTTRTIQGFPGTKLWKSLCETDQYDKARSSNFLLYPRFKNPFIREISMAFESLEEDFSEFDGFMYEAQLMGKLSNEIHYQVSKKIYKIIHEAISMAENDCSSVAIRDYVISFLPELMDIADIHK